MIALVRPEAPAHFRAMQRLMQALGTYGKLGHTDGRTHFLTHIPAAIPLLREVLAKIPGMEKLAALLSELNVSTAVARKSWILLETV